jgi:hypothetical protein
MNFTDPKLKKYYETHFIEADGLPHEERQVHALMAVHDQSQKLEGPHSSGVHETIWHLLLPRLRAELRRWYQRPGADQHPTAAALRDHLSRLAGEKI